MRHFRAVLVVAALLCTVTIALADNIPDPRIVIAGDEASIGVGKTFTFMANQYGGGFYGPGSGSIDPIGTPTFGTGLWNASLVDWDTLGIMMPIPYFGGLPIPYDPVNYPDYYTISASRFYNGFIVSTDINPGWMQILFFNSTQDPINNPPGPGIHISDHFTIDLRNIYGEGTDSNDSGGWLGSNGLPLSFYASGNPSAEWFAPASVPEPGSLTLFLGGLGLIGIKLIRGKKATKQG